MTAIEWLVKEVNSDCLNSSFIRPELIEKAKEMEKEQMHKCASFWRGKDNEIEKPMFDLYYKETYNKW